MEEKSVSQFLKIQIILNRTVSPYLQQIFSSRYTKESGKEWSYSNKHPTNIKKILNSLDGHQKKYLKESTSQWDISLLCKLLLRIEWSEDYIVENGFIENIRTIRNSMAHKSIL